MCWWGAAARIVDCWNVQPAPATVRRAGGDVGPNTKHLQIFFLHATHCLLNNSTAAITLICFPPDPSSAQRTLAALFPLFAHRLLAVRDPQNFAHRLTFAPNSNCTVPPSPRHQRTRHRQAGRPTLRAFQHCIGCDSQQTTFHRPTSLFHASRGSGTLSIQACEVSLVSAASSQLYSSIDTSALASLLTSYRPR